MPVLEVVEDGTGAAMPVMQAEEDEEEEDEGIDKEPSEGMDTEPSEGTDDRADGRMKEGLHCEEGTSNAIRL